MTAAPDEDDWLELFHGNVPALYRWVSRRAGGDRGLAEDVTQETWLRAVEAWRRGGTPDRPLAWLQKAARNLLTNHYRRVSPRPVDPAQLDLSARVELPGASDAALLLSWGLARVRAGQARLLEAYHLEGLDMAAIARAEGLSVRAVEGRLRRARLRLRRHLRPYMRGGER